MAAPLESVWQAQTAAEQEEQVARLKAEAVQVASMLSDLKCNEQSGRTQRETAKATSSDTTLTDSGGVGARSWREWKRASRARVLLYGLMSQKGPTMLSIDDHALLDADKCVTEHVLARSTARRYKTRNWRQTSAE